MTPPRHRGLLSGDLRAEMIDTGQAVVGVLGLPDRCGAARRFVANALRGLTRATLQEPTVHGQGPSV